MSLLSHFAPRLCTPEHIFVFVLFFADRVRRFRQRISQQRDWFPVRCHNRGLLAFHHHQDIPGGGAVIFTEVDLLSTAPDDLAVHNGEVAVVSGEQGL